MNNYHLYEEIGSGKFSTVYKGRKRHTIKYVAIKSVEKCRRAKVIHEYCCGGDLMRLLKQDNRIPMSQALEFGRDICEGLFFVHTRGVIYTDLKPSNVLFDESGALKLSDFGMAILLEDLVMDGAPIPRRGTPYYMAPELFLEDGTHSFASDLWSLGIVLHEFVTGKPPFQPSSFKELHNMILDQPPPSIDRNEAHEEYEDLVRRLLVKDPTERPE